MDSVPPIATEKRVWRSLRRTGSAIRSHHGLGGGGYSQGASTRARMKPSRTLTTGVATTTEKTFSARTRRAWPASGRSRISWFIIPERPLDRSTVEGEPGPGPILTRISTGPYAASWPGAAQRLG